MKTLKKVSVLLALCLTVIFVFMACGPKDSTPSSSTYTNEALNLKMTVPSTWTLYSEEQLSSEYNGGDTEPVIGKSFYEAFAQLTGGGDNVCIIVKNAAGQTETIKSLGIKSFTDLISEYVQGALEKEGATNIQYSLVNIDFPLKEYACINITCDLKGSRVFQKQIISLEGDYLYSIIITANKEEGVNDIIGFFSTLK